MTPIINNDEVVTWNSQALTFAIELEKYVTTLSLGGIALVTSLAKHHHLLASVGLGFLLITAFCSLRSMIYLWETSTMDYEQMPIKKSFSVKGFWFQILCLLIGFLVIITAFSLPKS